MDVTCLIPSTVLSAMSIDELDSLINLVTEFKENKLKDIPTIEIETTKIKDLRPKSENISQISSSNLQNDPLEVTSEPVPEANIEENPEEIKEEPKEEIKEETPKKLDSLHPSYEALLEELNEYIKDFIDLVDHTIKTGSLGENTKALFYELSLKFINFYDKAVGHESIQKKIWIYNDKINEIYASDRVPFKPYSDIAHKFCESLTENLIQREWFKEYVGLEPGKEFRYIPLQNKTSFFEKQRKKKILASFDVTIEQFDAFIKVIRDYTYEFNKTLSEDDECDKTLMLMADRCTPCLLRYEDNERILKESLDKCLNDIERYKLEY